MLNSPAKVQLFVGETHHFAYFLFVKNTIILHFETTENTLLTICFHFVRKTSNFVTICYRAKNEDEQFPENKKPPFAIATEGGVVPGKIKAAA